MPSGSVGLSLLGDTRESLSRFLREPFFGRASATFDQSGSLTLVIEINNGQHLAFTGTEALLDAVEASERDRVKKKIDEIFENSKPIRLSLPLREFHDRPSMWIELDLKSNDIGFEYEGSFAEIKPLKSVIEKISTVEKDLTQVLSVVPDLLFKLNSKGQFLGIFSNKLDTTFGSAEFIGKTPREVFDSKLAAVIDETLQKTFITGIPQVSECRIDLPDGPMVYDIRIAVLDDESCVLFLRDSHQVVDLGYVSRSGLSSEELIGKYLIHEVSGPVQLIDMQVARLKKDCEQQYDSSPSVKNAIRKLEAAARHSKDIIRYMRHFLGDPQDEPYVEMDVDGLVKLTSEIVDPILRSHNKHLNWNVSLNGKVWAARRTLIVQMLVNLIQNAVEASTDNNESIDLSIIMVGDQVDLTVSNVGKEITERELAVLSRLFQSTKNSQKNMGIGLFWICRIVHLHSGEISVHQEKGRTVFKIELPLISNN